MALPAGIVIKYINSKTHVLKLECNLYGQKHDGRVWNLFLSTKLKKIGFTQSCVDECVFYRGNIIFICYVDDGIFAGLMDEEIDAAIADL
eukprot:4098793-Ditylum_brightwellii.AAC.2